MIRALVLAMVVACGSSAPAHHDAAIDAVPPDAPTCMSAGACRTGPSCGSGCCGEGEYCASGTCMCGSGGPCTGGDVCNGAGLATGVCGSVCCGVSQQCPI